MIKKHEALTATLSLHLSHVNALNQHMTVDRIIAIISAEEGGLLPLC